MARRLTADGVSIDVWSDGTLTTRWAYVSGLGTLRSRYTQLRRERAVRLISGDLSLYDLAELSRAVKLAESTLRNEWSSDDARRAWVRRHA